MAQKGTGVAERGRAGAAGTPPNPGPSPDPGAEPFKRPTGLPQSGTRFPRGIEEVPGKSIPGWARERGWERRLNGVYFGPSSNLSCC